MLKPGETAAPLTLDEDRLAVATYELAGRDTRLAGVLECLGVPPLWERVPGFPTLVHIILEQQVSLASARAAFMRLEQWLGVVTPAGFLTLDDHSLRVIGFSRQKALYCRLLAAALEEQRFDLAVLATLPDELAKAALMSFKGVGHWTADIYLLMALLRADVWPQGDLALAVAWQELCGLEVRPTPEALMIVAESWRPYRAVGARLLWLYYLEGLSTGQK